jgi:hypothetical protein
MKMKITEKIQGYDKMTPEEKIAALEGYELTDPDYSGYVKKEVFDKTASELSDYKKQLREKLSADEIKAREDAEKQEKLQNDYDALVRKVALSENKAKLLGLGYDEKLATDTAEAMLDGNIDKVLANQKKHLDAVEKKIRENVLQDTPKPEGGSSSNEMTKEKLRGMSAQERYEYSVAHPNEYKQIYGGK